MKNKIFFLLIFFFLDCATYWQHRRKDLQDIVTVGIEGKGYGVGGRLGPLPFGFFFQDKKNKDKVSNQNKANGIGLRGGNLGRYHTEQLVFGFLGGEKFYIQKKANDLENQRNEKKSHSIRYFDFYNQTPKERLKEKRKKYTEKMIKKIAEKHNQKIDLSTLQKKKKTYPTSFFFQIEIFFGFPYGLRFGLNFSELTDFILGFINLDILKDDLKK